MTAQKATDSDACSVVGRHPIEDSIAARADIERMRAALSDSIAAASSQLSQCSSEPSTTQTPKLQHKSSTPPDSGYASLVNTPNSPSQRTLTREECIDFRSRRLFPRKTKKLRMYDREIDQPTQTRFLDLKVLVGRTLQEFLVKKKVTFTAIQMRLSVLGEDEASAKPWIIVACEKAILKTVKQFFGQTDIREELRPNTSGWPSFELIVCDRALRLLTADIDIEVFADGWGLIEGHSVLGACGVAIQTAVGERTRTATLGGIVEVLSKTGETKSYGLTAGHILPSDSVSRASENELEVMSVDEDRLDTDDSQAESYAVQDINLEPPDRPRLDHPFSGSNEEEFEIEFGYGSMSPCNDLISQGREPQPGEHNLSYATNIGRIIAHSGQSKPSVEEDCNQDWALIGLNEAQLAIGNYLIYPHGDSGPHRLQLTQFMKQETLQIDGERPVGVIRTAPSLSWGVLSRALSFIMISPGNAFTETYTLTMGSKSGLKAGDSGSWVFDCQNYKVYGHIVAVDLFGEGIVVPMHAILMDIKREFDAAAVRLHEFFGKPGEMESLPHTPVSSPPPIFDSGYVSMDVTPRTLFPGGPDSFTPKSRDSFIDSACALLGASPYARDLRDADPPDQPRSLKRRGSSVDSTYSSTHVTPVGSARSSRKRVELSGFADQDRDICDSFSRRSGRRHGLQQPFL